MGDKFTLPASSEACTVGSGKAGIFGELEARLRSILKKAAVKIAEMRGTRRN
jgi:hypothetical protein